MIGKLKGTLDSRGADWAIVDVHGVGYLVHCSVRTLDTLPAVGEAVTLSIETYVREQEIRLFGFSHDAEREWFRLLMTVQGVGARVALAVLGTLGAGELGSAISLQDKAMVARAPGVGPKVAGRIVTELKDRAPALVVGLGSDSAHARLEAELGSGAAPRPAAEAVSALVNLGYAQAQAASAVAAALKDAGDDAETAVLIRRGLKELAG